MQGDLDGARKAQLTESHQIIHGQSQFPGGHQDLANMLGLDVGKPYTPNLPGHKQAIEAMEQQMRIAGI